MDASRQRASNDKILGRDLIANRNSSAKHRMGLAAENKRLFLPVPGEYSDPRDCSIAESDAPAFNLHAYSRRGLTRSCRCNRSVGDISNHERAPADVDIGDNGEGREQELALPAM